MKTFFGNQAKGMVFILLIGVLAGSTLTTAYLNAGPVATSNQEKNTSTKTRWKRAKYLKDTLAVYTVYSKTENSEPAVILIGQVLADVVLPGKDSTDRMLGLCYMYVNEDELTRFPHALTAVKRDEIACEVINTSDPVQGLNQIRIAYAKAHGISTEDLPPIEE